MLKYSNFKAFHFPSKIVKLSMGVIPVPIHIRIKPTNKCNHNCYYCSYRLKGVQIGKDMNLKDSIQKEKMFEIIGDMAEMGVKAVTFSGGGDPLCYKHIADSIKLIHSSGMELAMLTNGSRLELREAYLLAHLATWLRISIDGWDGKSYAKCRNVKETEFNKIIDNIKWFKKLKGNCCLGVVIVVDINNYTHIYEMATLMKDCGVDSLKIAPVILSNNIKSINLYHDCIYACVRKEIDKVKKLEDDNFEVYDSYHKQMEGFDKEYNWCPYMQLSPVIGADMNVYTCHDKAYNLDTGLLGSIKNRRFKDFWFDGVGKFLKTDPTKVCNHHCMADKGNKLILEYLNIDKNHRNFI